MSENHTPTPWRIGGKGTIRYGHKDDPLSGWIGDLHWRNREANAAFIVRAVNAHDELVKALENIFSRISYVNIHGVGEQPEPTGEPQPIRVGKDEFWRLFQEIGTIASAALDKAEAKS